jgi:hypothetical protein
MAKLDLPDQIGFVAGFPTGKMTGGALPPLQSRARSCGPPERAVIEE